MAELPDYQAFLERIIVVEPPPGEVVEITANGIPLKVFRVSHGEPENDFSLDNLAMSAELGSTRILVTGDIVPTGQTEVFRRARLDRDSIDFAFLAFTLFGEDQQPEGMAIIDEHIQPRRIVVAHLYDSHFGAFTEAIRTRYPNAIIFENR